MAEEPKGWMKESELALIRAKQNLDQTVRLQTTVTKLAVVLRDLVYIEVVKNEGEHTAALKDHLMALDDMCAEVPLNEP